MKWLLPVGAIVVLVVAVAANWLGHNKTPANSNSLPNANTPTNDSAVDTSAWKTYTNTKFGYSFKYPDIWLLQDSPYSSIPSPTADGIAFGDSSSRFRVEFPQEVFGGCSTLNDCAAKASVASNTSAFVTSGLQNTMVGSQSALKETVRNTPGLTSADKSTTSYVYTMHRGSLLIVSFTSTSTAASTEDSPTLAAILASFVFSN